MSKPTFDISHKFLVRIPLLPYTSLVELLGLSTKEFEDQFLLITKNPSFRLAILISSISVYEQLLAWETGKILDEKRINKLKASLFKYLIRASTRPTPFGMLAGSFIGGFNDQTEMQLMAGKDSLSLSVLPDMHLLDRMRQNMCASGMPDSSLKYYSNPTLYPVGERLRYIEYSQSVSAARNFQYSSVDGNYYLNQILEVTKNGAQIDQLIEVLVKNDIVREDAMEFISELIANMIILSELELSSSPKSYRNILKTFMESRENSNAIFKSCSDHLDQIDKLSGRVDLAGFEDAILRLSKVYPSDNQTLIQVNLFKKTIRNTITKGLASNIHEAFDIMTLLSSQEELVELKEFKDAFLARYEGRFVRLVDALDPENGLGYPPRDKTKAFNDNVIENIDFDSLSESVFPRARTTKIEEFLQTIYFDAIHAGNYTVDLKEYDLSPLQSSKIPIHELSDSFYLASELYSKSAKDLDRGQFSLFIKQFVGPSSARITSRFSDDPEIREFTREIIKTEEAGYENVVFAEINHVPQARQANIISFSEIRSFEIPFVIAKDLSKPDVIELRDILIGFRDGKLRLFSQKIKKEIIPCLTNSFNYSLDSIPIYRLLCDFQLQCAFNLSWTWGAFHASKFLPRVSYGNVILARAKWQVDIPGDVTSLVVKEIILKLRQDLQLPRYLSLTEKDTALLIDIENDKSIELLTDFAKRHQKLVVEESLVTSEPNFITDNTGAYNGEFIFALSKSIKSLQPMPEVSPESQGEYIFLPGSTWLYFKIYCGVKASDHILDSLCEKCQGLIENQFIDKWFFLRFADPDYHIRLRLNGQQDFHNTALNALLPLLSQLKSEGQIIGYSINSYERELNKYPICIAPECEDFFFHDSNSIIKILHLLSFNFGDKRSWLVALKSIDVFLNDFGLSLSSKLMFVKEAATYYFAEFGLSKDKKFVKSVNRKYAENKALIEGLLCADEFADFSDFKNVFTIRSSELSPIVSQIKSKIGDSISLNELIGNLLHMHFLRFFKTKQRLKEAIVYKTLQLYYVSQSIRQASAANLQENG